MKWLNIKAILIMSVIFGMATGCNWYRKKVYLAPNQIAELAKPAKVTVFITNKATGKKEIRVYEAQPGRDWIGRK